MTAPALVALAHGSRDPRSAQTIKALVDEVRGDAPRPAHRAGVPRAGQALLRHGGRPAGPGRATTRSSSYPCCSPRPTTPRSTSPRRSPRRPPRTTACGSGPPGVLGLESAFLEVLDRRLRAALSDARVRELDALVLAAAGSSDHAGQPGRRPAGPAVGLQAPAADGRGVRLGRSPGHRRGGAAVPGRGPPPHRGRARCSWRPGCSPTGPPSWRSRPARSPCPRRSAPTRRSPAPSWRATPSGAVELVPV